MKEIIKRYWWIIVIVLFIGSVFYWFQWRPSEIRKKCADFSWSEAEYKQCIRTKGGLEK